MDTELTLLSFIAAAAVAAASGIVGSFALMRRMSLAADAMSHVALPGLGIALLLAINPLVGGAAALLIGAAVVWAVEQRTRISTDAIIGVIFSASLAVGALLTPEGELLDILFGNLGAVNAPEAIIGIVFAAAIGAIMLALKERFALAFLSPDLAATTGLSVRMLNLVFLVLFAAAIILGLKFLGVLLMGSLIIVPAAAARNIARSFRSDLITSSIIAVVAVLAGAFIASRFTGALGPTIISVAAAIFFISIFASRR